VRAARLLRQGAFLAVGVLPTLACVLAVAGPATASRGVSVDLGRIDIQQTLAPGGSYRLPTMGVRNPGTETTSYTMTVTPVTGVDAPESSWVRFSPERLTLRPAQSLPVRMRLSIPTGAEPGQYEALVGAEMAGKGPGGRVGGAAAARVTFEVEPSSALAAWWLRIRTFFEDRAPWSYVFPAVVLVLGALVLMRRRFRVTVARRA
jgi:hypothetical protein